jgi:hypothetical protein
VTVVVAGTNTISSTARVHAGIECSLASNITVQAEGDRSLFVTGGTGSAGIGTGGNGTCGWMSIQNGSIDSVRGSGIGAGCGECGRQSRLEGLIIYGGRIRAEFDRL